MGTRKNRLDEAVLTSTHNLFFGEKINKKICMTLHSIKVGYEGVYITRTCCSDDETNSDTSGE